MRIYARALTQNEIVADMTTPIESGGALPDTAPPVITNGAPAGQLPSGTMQATLSVDTDEPASCRYSPTPGSMYSSMANGFSTTAGTSHAALVSGLVDGAVYSFFVRCLDSSANVNQVDYPITFSITVQGGGAGSALRFYATGSGPVNQVRIPLDAPPSPADIGAGSFTIEWWMKGNLGENAPTGTCSDTPSSWINGNIILDRDVFGSGDYGDYGISLFNGVLAFGVEGTSSAIVCGATDVLDGQWHHVAVTRNGATGEQRVYVDGLVDGVGVGPTGDVSYRDGRATSWPQSDPYLAVGAEKHFGPEAWNGFAGWMDELRLSTSVRYATAFVPPSQAFVPDADTAALYHFDEGGGLVLGDSSGASGGPSDGTLAIGGSPAGPEWVASDAPLLSP